MTFAAALAMAALAWGGGPTTAPAQKKAPAKKPATTAPVKPAPGKPAVAKPAATLKGPTVAVSRRGVKPAPRSTTTWRNRQTAPSSDRYKEIQDALVAKGYLPSEGATGAWDQASADALKKFQGEQTLETTGKINSMSLIALGLGPKHDSTIPRPVDGNYPQPEMGRN
jgi:Putative peptidoglycan binding domain